MKIGIVIGGILIIGALLLIGRREKKAMQPTSEAMNTHGPVQVLPVEHASVILRWAGKAIYFDPAWGAEKYAGQQPAYIVLLTDIHSDHLDLKTLAAVSGNASLIAPEVVAGQLPEPLASRTHILANGETATEQGFAITAIPMYNLPGSDSARFHTKGRGNGYLIERDGYRVYLAGDTAGTPELRAMQDIDLAFVPMNLPYTMSVDEAADAVLAFKPKVVYPYHYRNQDGLSDVTRFKSLVQAGDQNIEVVLANWYPQ